MATTEKLFNILKRHLYIIAVCIVYTTFTGNAVGKHMTIQKLRLGGDIHEPGIIE